MITVDINAEDVRAHTSEQSAQAMIVTRLRAAGFPLDEDTYELLHGRMCFVDYDDQSVRRYIWQEE